MSNVIEFKREKWCAGSVKCFQCKHEWVAVWPEGLLHLYCPECDGPHGLPLDEPRPSRPIRPGNGIYARHGISENLLKFMTGETRST
jgi:hypothetical protein